MRDLTEITVAETRYFKGDVIPFRALITASKVKEVSSPFVFKNVEITEDENKNFTALEMKAGEFHDDKKVYPIDFLSIRRNRIDFAIKADSDIAEKFYKAIYALLSNIDPDGRFSKNEPILKTSGCTCNVTLDFDYKDIFSKKLNDFISKKAHHAFSKAINDVADIEISPESLAFSISCNIKDSLLKENNIKRLSKTLIIEPRAGFSLKERRYFTSSPTDSKTHLNLLSELEKTFHS